MNNPRPTLVENASGTPREVASSLPPAPRADRMSDTSAKPQLQASMARLRRESVEMAAAIARRRAEQGAPLRCTCSACAPEAAPAP